MTGSLLLLEDVAPVSRKTPRRFTVWVGSSIPTHYANLEELCGAAWALLPPGQWDEVELLLKAGEGGTWQSAFDPSPLSLGSMLQLSNHIAIGAQFNTRITPYVVVRARPGWIAAEQVMINACVSIAGRCILNVEPGAQYYNGPADAINGPPYIRNYLRGCHVPASALEVCTIPRATQVGELGGVVCLQAWTDPTLVGGASWECYGLAAPGPGVSSLQTDVAIPRLDGWGIPSELEYRIPVVQHDERTTWCGTIWAAAGLQIWWLDGN